MKFLDETGLAHLWSKIKSIIPTKTSQLANDSGYAKVVNLATVADYEALGTYDSNTLYCVDEEG